MKTESRCYVCGEYISVDRKELFIGDDREFCSKACVLKYEWKKKAWVNGRGGDEKCDC